MRAILAPVLAFLLIAAQPAMAQDMSFGDPGVLQGAGGYTPGQDYVGDIRFPIEHGPAYANSQVYGVGGMNGPAGSQCAPANYSYPWHDDFCEGGRSWAVPLCTSGKGHQGQDIRPPTCLAGVYYAVAAEDGAIAQIGSYSVTLQTKTGRLYRYLHLDMKHLSVHRGDKVKRGDRIGLVSNFFGDSSTTIHLHFDIKDTVLVNGKPTKTYLPPYTALVRAYKTLMGAP